MGYIMELRGLVGSRPLIMVGACVLVICDQRLLLQRRKDNGLWALPGGSLEPGETLQEVAKRELFEETGLAAGELELLDIFSGEELYYKYPHGDEVYNVVAGFVCKAYEGELQADGAEVQDLRFFSFDELPSDLCPPDIPIIHRFLAREVK